MKFQLTSKYSPTGDQPEAIKELTDGIKQGEHAQVLLGVTGSGKTFTMANVINNINRPTLILSHNKTLAAQLYEEMKSFFPNNAVEYYVSYYDYYQPEAYLPTTDTYIEKDLAINEDIDKLRLATVSALLSGRQDVVVVSSVSCIYGMGQQHNKHKARTEHRPQRLFATARRGVVCAQRRGTEARLLPRQGRHGRRVDGLQRQHFAHFVVGR